MNKKLRILFLTNGIFIIAGALLGPLYAIFVDTFDVTPLTISLSWATMLTSSLITFYIISKKVDDEKNININLLVAGYLISGLAWILYLLVSSVVFLFAVQVLLGVGLAAGGPSWLLLVTNNLDEDKGVYNFAQWSMISKVVEIAAVTGGGIIVTTLGFKTLFFAMAIVAFVSAGLLLSLKKQL